MRVAQCLQSRGFMREGEECLRKWGDLKQRALKYKGQRNLTGMLTRKHINGKRGFSPTTDIKLVIMDSILKCSTCLLK